MILKTPMTSTYWGGDVYLDEIHYLEDADEPGGMLSAVATGQFGCALEFGVEQHAVAKSDPKAQIVPTRTAQTVVCRFQVSQKPFNDPRVRQAIMASDNPDKVFGSRRAAKM